MQAYTVRSKDPRWIDVRERDQLHQEQRANWLKQAARPARCFMTEITIATYINAPQEVCFDVARDVAAHVESASFSNEKLVAPGRLEGLLELGDLVCFEGRHFGFRQRFCAKITRLERPFFFVDEMVSGAFTSMRHVHEFSASEGGTVMVDHLTWRSPLWLLGRLADMLFLKRHMRWFVITKQLHLKRIAEACALTIPRGSAAPDR